jgi:prepilin signal peptidase PulO-like enzyme (type II secretory pathway)
LFTLLATVTTVIVALLRGQKLAQSRKIPYIPFLFMGFALAVIASF